MKYNTGKPTLAQFRRAAMSEEAGSLAVLIDQLQNPGMTAQMVNLPSQEGGKTALHLAAWRGSLVNVKLLVTIGADVNLISTGEGNYGKSSFMYIAIYE